MFGYLQIRGKILEGFKMESKADTDDKTDSSPTETTVYSTIRADSFWYRRTYSEISAFSDFTDDNSYSDSPSTVCWTDMKPSNQAVHKRLGMRQKKLSMDDSIENQEPVDIGKFNIMLFFAVLLFYFLSLHYLSISCFTILVL